MMTKVIDFKDLKNFKFKKKRGRHKISEKLPHDLTIEITWTDYDKDGLEIMRSITCAPNSPWETLKSEGKKVVVEKCLQIVGKLYNSDPSLEAELRERLEHLFKDESQ